MPGAKAAASSSDVFATFSIIADGDMPSWIGSIEEAAESIADRYKYYEVLIVGVAGHDSQQALVERLARKNPHVRLIQVDRASSFDQLATVAYRESIGDAVVVASGDELPLISVPRILELLNEGRQLVRVRRRTARLDERLSAGLVRHLTGFETDIRYLRTMGFSRGLLSDLSSHPGLSQYFRFRSLRFEPNSAVLEIEAPAPRAGGRALLDRLSTVVQLLSLAAPRWLRFAAASSAALALLAAGWLAYVLLAWMLKPGLAEGWLSLSLLIGFGLFIQTAVSAVLCLGLLRLLEAQEASVPFRIVGDISSSDLFRDFMLLNIETSDEDQK